MAMLIVPMSVLNEDCNVGTTLTNDCANNQNVSTPIIIPISNLLSPQIVLKTPSRKIPPKLP